MTGVWAMATGHPGRPGSQGPEHAIDVAAALRLYTLGTAGLLGEAGRRGSITPGKLVGLVACRLGLLAAGPGGLASLNPVAFTIGGGRPAVGHDKRLTR